MGDSLWALCALAHWRLGDLWQRIRIGRCASLLINSHAEFALGALRLALIHGCAVYRKIRG